MSDERTLLDLAHRAARDAGALLLERFGSPARGVGAKSSETDMVSDADRDAEERVVAMIRAERPDDAIFGEEGGDRVAGTSGYTWVIDPLDGTTNFLYGIPQWCVSVAVEDASGAAVAGVIVDPCRAEAWSATRGGGAELNGASLRCSSETTLSSALLATGFGYRPDERSAWGDVVRELLPIVRDIRRAGSAALDLAWCAAGRVDVYAEAPCRRWDRAAGMLIAREAGCRVELLPGDGVVAAPPALFDALRTYLPT